MRRYWIQKSQIGTDGAGQQVVTFKEDQFHHIFEVCRQEVGHHFEVLAEDGKAYLVEVIRRDKKNALARVIEERVIKKQDKPYIHLALSISRYAVMDSIVEKSVEMGVTSILPFCSDFSFIRKPDNLPAGKIERWQKIVISATQQSGRGELMAVYEPCDWQKMLVQINPGPKNWCLFAYEGASVLTMQQYFKIKKGEDLETPDNIWIIVGSEGGFSSQEVTEMQKLGLDPVTLGSQVLRVETACMTLVSILKYEFELLK